ncbi:hypothetical protein ARMSODRAFT_347117 [Armillaria solidipes]|uniref:Uncharacterized protein n=1 Tax=Armillaria solidipes TaxID=1076256 RepID=A0A2H3BSJ3_9AGAR|nr:hypothetical protein ARMSODRAFT_347117 [Armillaria solidipes]
MDTSCDDRSPSTLFKPCSHSDTQRNQIWSFLLLIDCDMRVKNAVERRDCKTKAGSKASRLATQSIEFLWRICLSGHVVALRVAAYFEPFASIKCPAKIAALYVRRDRERQADPQGDPKHKAVVRILSDSATSAVAGVNPSERPAPSETPPSHHVENQFHR